MKALVKARAAPGLEIQDIPEPTIGINDVLIRVHRTGICGTDVHIYDWDEWAQQTIPVPMAIGHEFVGEIVAVGSNVIDFHPGELVSGEGHVVCGRCRNCMAGPAAPVRAHLRRRREPAWLFRGIHLVAHDQYLAARSQESIAMPPPSSIPSATPCTPRCRSMSWAKMS